MTPDEIKELARIAQRTCVQEGWAAAVLAVRSAVIDECAEIAEYHYESTKAYPDGVDPIGEGYRAAAFNIQCAIFKLREPTP